jgi:hypothetical protein
MAAILAPGNLHRTGDADGGPAHGKLLAGAKNSENRRGQQTRTIGDG